MSEDQPQDDDVEQAPQRLGQWINLFGSVIAPASLISAVLFYFGYVSSRSEYAYFGIDVDVIGLSTQDYVMRSPQALLVPVLVIAGGAGALWHLGGRLRVRPALAARVRKPLLIVGLALVLVGVLLIAAFAAVRDWAGYGLATPAALGTGVGLTVYARQLTRVRPRLGVLAAAFAILGTCLFWSTATVAQWTGLGIAKNTARHLNDLPAVVLDTKEQLYLRDPGVSVTQLPAEAGQTFRYRYRGLRLLIRGNGLLFLVPDTWSASNSTLVLPLDGDVRVQFPFVNDPP